ncbi:MAG TPA: GGDEF domain-containing protein [Gaiellaceae bacterium]|nr:GGDEF domain-containing protein [Gaiellaceae bacterium]
MTTRSLADRSRRLTRAQWALLGAAIALLVVLELVLMSVYVGIGRADDDQRVHSANTVLLSNLQSGALRLAFVADRTGATSSDAARQRALLERHFRAAEVLAEPVQRRSFDRMRALLERYDRELVAATRGRAGPQTVFAQVPPVLEQLELEAKRAFDAAELDFSEGTSVALGAQRRSQELLLLLGAGLILLVLPLGLVLHRLIVSELSRFSTFPRLSPFPVVELTPSHLTFANSAAELLADGFDPPMTVEALLPKDWQSIVARQLESDQPSTVVREVEVSGRTLAWSIAAMGSQHVAHGYGDDVTERKRAVERVASQSRVNAQLALCDSLTALGNRRKLMEDADRKLPLASRDAPIVLAIFDLDGFTRYNDGFGHQAGDALLARLGRRLRDALPGEATAYRTGGDEFCVLADSGDLVGIVAVAQEALYEEGASFVVRASVGSALVPAEATSLSEALHLADARLYAYKRAPRRSARLPAAGYRFKPAAPRRGVRHARTS